MTLIRYIEWILSILAGSGLVVLLESFLKRIRKKWIKVLIFFVKFTAMSALAFGLIATTSSFFWNYAFPLTGIYIALLSDCICDILMLILSFRKKETKKSLRTVLFGCIAAVVSVYGTFTAQNIREDHISFMSDKLDTSHRFVFLSDLHYGSSQSQASFEKTLVKIKAASPEFILLGGDICDEYTEKEEMQWVFEEFGKMDVPVYYFYGNHDRQENSSCAGGKRYSGQEFEAAVLSNGIIILKDEWTAFSDDIVLLGREDASHPDERLAVEELPARPEDSYVICVDHSPFQNEDILKTKADLQLSGHTHAGQVFPIRWIYELARLNVVYTYRIGDTDLYVSPGIGNWCCPFRNETHCSYAVIDLVKG